MELLQEENTRVRTSLQLSLSLLFPMDRDISGHDLNAWLQNILLFLNSYLFYLKAEGVELLKNTGFCCRCLKFVITNRVWA